MDGYAMHSLIHKLDDVQSRINAASSCSAYKQKVKLVAVTKTHPPEKLEMVYHHGVRVFGENRVQELLTKKNILPDDIEWHLIGPLQTNKVKTILPHVKLIHSLDRENLAEELDKRAGMNSFFVNTLIEVNVAKEESKHGILPEEVSDFVHYLSNKNNIKVIGLMTVAPYTDKPEEVRWVFQRLRKLFVDLQSLNLPNIEMQWLSMGMTNDFEIAIEEGSNLVRIGSGIFGFR